MIASAYLIHDNETGGLDCTKNPITEYAAIVLDYKTLKEVDRFHTYVKPYGGLTLTKESLEKTGNKMVDINNGMEIKGFISSVSEFYGKHQSNARYADARRLISVGHNIPFDHRFLEYAFDFQKKDFWAFVQDYFIDTMMLAKMLWGLEGNEKMRLSDCITRAGLKITDAHSAMNDVEATADLFRWFTKRLRRKTGETESSAKSERARGNAFFEFACGK